MSEWCEHSGCDYQNRMEYCEIDAAELDGSAGLVAELLDTLIYSDAQVSSDEYRLSSDANEQVLTRNFSYIHGDGASWVWPLMQTHVAISHVQNKSLGSESYTVELQWQVEQQGTSNRSMRIVYGMDIYPHGAVQAYVDEPDLIDTDGNAMDGRTIHRMVNYDYTQLFDQLTIVYELHAAERLDNSRFEL